MPSAQAAAVPALHRVMLLQCIEYLELACSPGSQVVLVQPICPQDRHQWRGHFVAIRRDQPSFTLLVHEQESTGMYVVPA